ncbi:MAG: HD domain-containing protein [Deltaproteobacteria bacterium]
MDPVFAQNLTEEIRRRAGETFFIAGGPVRDLFLGRVPPDIDLVFPDGAVSKARDFAARTGGSFVLLDEDEGVARVVLPGLILDFSQYRSGARTLAEDLAKRDFTINAMALPGSYLPTFLSFCNQFTPEPEDEAGGGHIPRMRRISRPPAQDLIDPLGGLQDLDAGLIRAICRENLKADPLRLLRAYRFRAQLDFRISSETDAWIRELGLSVSSVSTERITHELDLILESKRGGRTFSEMAGTSLLFAVLPELASLSGVEQPLFHHLDCLGHSLEALSCVEVLMGDPAVRFSLTDPLRDWYAQSPSRRIALSWAALLHDMAKPACRMEKDGRPTFYHHDRTGAEMVERLGGRLRWSMRRTRTVSRLVSLHMRPFHLLNDLRRGGPSKRAMRRLLVEAGEDFPALFLLAMADSMAGCGPLKPPELDEELDALWVRVCRFYWDHFLPVSKEERLLTGHDIQKILGLTPGPLVGKALEAIEDARAEGLVSNREEAVRYLVEWHSAQ